LFNVPIKYSAEKIKIQYWWLFFDNKKWTRCYVCNWSMLEIIRRQLIEGSHRRRDSKGKRLWVWHIFYKWSTSVRCEKNKDMKLLLEV